MNETTETTDIAPGIYRDRDGDTWVILADMRALQLSQRPHPEFNFDGGPLPVAAIADHARRGGVRAEALASVFGPLIPRHVFGEVAE